MDNKTREKNEEIIEATSEKSSTEINPTDEALDKAKEATAKATAVAKDFAESELVKEAKATLILTVSKDPMKAIDIAKETKNHLWIILFGLHALLTGFAVMLIPSATLRDLVGRAEWREIRQFARQASAFGQSRYHIPHGALFFGGVVVSIAVFLTITICVFIISSMKKKNIVFIKALNLASAVLLIATVSTFLAVVTSFISAWISLVLLAIAIIGTVVMFHATIIKLIGQQENTIWHMVISYVALTVAFYFSLVFAFMSTAETFVNLW